jgi:hypothetical protein
MIGCRPASIKAVKNGDYASLAVRILARPIHVGIAQDRVVYAKIGFREKQMVFDVVLGGAVGIERIDGMILGHRQRGGLAIHGAAGRGIDDLGDSMFPAHCEQVDRTDEVHLSVFGGLVERLTYIGPRRLMV